MTNTEIALNQDLSTGELLQKFQKENRRTVQRRIQYLKKTNQISKEKIRGKKGKRKRWIIPEETTNDIWIRVVPENFDRKNPKIINAKITQRNLSQMISQAKRFYQKELKKSKKKKEPYDQFVSYHLAVASGCMEWILQLTWAINAGVFSKSNNKLNLAKRNRTRYEEFLKQVIDNLRARNEENFKAISATVYNLLTHSSLMENVFYPNDVWEPELATPKAMSLH